MTVSTNLSPYPIFHQETASGVPASGYKVFTYAAGTTTKQTTYTDGTGAAPNTNPVILDSNGNANIWLDQTLTYKFVFAPPTDTDPPTNPVWTVDNIYSAAASSILNGSASWTLPDEANGDAIPAPGSKRPYLSAGVLKIA